MAASNAPAPSPTVPRSVLDVTELPPIADILHALTEQLAAWMPRQRWYAHKTGGAPQVEVTGWAPLSCRTDALVLTVVIQALPADGPGALYQVPIVLRHPEDAPTTAELGSEIGVLAVHGGPLRVDDATRDPAGRHALLTQLLSGAPALGDRVRLSVQPGPAAADQLPWAGARANAPVHSRILSGEQSNTSLIFEQAGTRPLIMKLFRILSDGENPDVQLQGALSAAGCDRVPAVAGAVRLACDDLRTDSAFAQEFLPDVEDAWRVALDRAAAGADFREPARALGTALAEVHRELAAAFGTAPTSPQQSSALLEQMRDRLEQAAREVDGVAQFRGAVESVQRRAASAPWPPMQRIHGDLHLGQVLTVPGRGWVLLDFEGEPLRPLAQRTLPDCPLRDVAGMLRSFDYAAGAVRLERGIDASGWAADARSAFLGGYADAIGVPESSMGPLLGAFEADKAVYEALYEARNRPDWLPIPQMALERISAAAAEAESAG